MGATRAILGLIIVIAGLFVIFSPEKIIRNSSLNPGRLFGDDRWTGEITRGGRVFLYLLGMAITALGLFELVIGLLEL
jgi:hypothetical protein